MLITIKLLPQCVDLIFKSKISKITSSVGGRLMGVKDIEGPYLIIAFSKLKQNMILKPVDKWDVYTK